MQLGEIVDDLKIDNVVIFDKDAIVIYQKGNIDEMVVIELTDFFKQVGQFELLPFSEINMSFSGKKVLCKQLGDFYLTAIIDEKNLDEKLPFHFLLLYNKVKRELQ